MKLIACPKNEEIAYLQDAIYEGIGKTDKPEALRFTEKIIDTIQPGADLSMVWPRFALQLLSASDSPIYESLQQNSVKDAAYVVASLFRDWVTTGTKPTKDLWDAARADAAAACLADAWSAARAAAGAAAGAASWAAWSAARAAAGDAAGAASWAAGAAAAAARAAGTARAAAGAAMAAGDAAWLWMRDLLLRLISESPGFGDDR